MSEIQNKMITIEEAAEIIPDGSNLAIGGFAETNNPMSIVRQLIRMRKRHLELSGMGMHNQQNFCAERDALTKSFFQLYG